MTYRGIDYGLGKTNIDRESGIRYGVIPVRELFDWIYEELEPQYGDPTCPSCGAECITPITELSDDISFEVDPSMDYACESCEECFTSDESFPESPWNHTIEKDGYIVESDHDCIDLFVIKSPYFTRAQFCSPCAPGACYLTNPVIDGDMAYCFGHDWFEGGKAPYPVYSVETGEEVKPSK